MAIISPFRDQKKRMVLLSIERMVQLQATKAALTTNFRTEIKINAFKVEEAQCHCDGNVKTLCEQGGLKKALEILQFMNPGNMRETYAFLLQGCGNKKTLPEGKLVHAHIILMSARGFVPNIFLGNTLVNMYVQCGTLADARRVLEQMPQRNVVSWTVMIAAYARYGYGEEVLHLYYQMRRTGIQSNEFTLASVLAACADLATLQHGKRIHEDIIKGGFQSDVFVGSALIDMYTKCGSIENARKVFDKMSERDVVLWTAIIAGYAQNGYVDEALHLFQKMPQRNVFSFTAVIAGYAQNGYFNEAMKLFQQMPERDVISWNAMIAGYAQNGQLDETLKLFRQMQLTGVRPDPDTFSCVLVACTSLAALEQAKEVHGNIIRSGFQCDVFVANALIDMYAKCGSIEDACHVFDSMPRRDVVSWTAIILGYAMHGYGKEALQLFEQMQHSAMNPDHVTFIGVLSACCHAGLVDEGWKFFKAMSRHYHITPVMEHYCCMVDLLGRAGHLGQAQDFISKMPIKPSAAVWISLLGACRLHANIELGEHVAECLFELEPKNAAPYVLLSNIYAAAGRWDDIQKVQKMMKDRGIKKKPGCSWIEVSKKVHAFLVGDRSHPQTQIIYAKLERLSGQMKEAGYVPDTLFVPNDVQEEQKDHILDHHSEKLAIAFGLINTFPGTPIRILKNLRVCGDCHSATKFISKIVAREIVVRDANRFHHFKDGKCSCGDYW
eukprot:Gb_02194 [translate_table: standard]